MAEVKGRKKGLWLGLGVGLIIVVLLIIAVYHYLYQPYKQMWQIGVRHLMTGDEVDARRIGKLMTISDSVHVSFVDPKTGKGHRDLFCPL